MATIHGKDADVTVTGVGSDYVVNAHGWSLDLDFGNEEDTNWDWTGGDIGWRSYIAGLKGWTASVDVYMDDGMDADLLTGGSLALKFYVDLTNTKGFDGDALVSGISPDVDIDGIEGMTVELQGTGELGII